MEKPYKTKAESLNINSIGQRPMDEINSIGQRHTDEIKNIGQRHTKLKCHHQPY